MTRDSLLVILVPGRDDRAFYKRFFTYIARKLGFQFIDLDTRDPMEEKRAILDKICKQRKHSISREESSNKGKGSILRGASVVKLLSTDRDRGVHVAIVPSEKRVTQIASIILGYQAGLDKPSIDFMVVADDAEEKDFNEKLISLYNSLRSLSYFEIDREISNGEYYRLYILRKPREVKLMLFVQGLRQVTTVVKHAIEDYALYLYRDIVNEIIDAVNTCPRLIDINVLETHMHKKLALLVALKLCYTRIEELFLRSLDDNKLDELLQICDGLNILTNTVANILSI